MDGKPRPMGDKMHTVEHLRTAARRRLPRLVFDFVDGGAGPESALAGNLAAFARTRLLPRALVDCDHRSPATELFGRRYAAPFGVAPIGLANVVWPGTDEALARTAAAADIPYILSTAGTTAIERIAEVAPKHAWFQLYAGRDQRIVDDLLARAERAGMEALLVTVDVQAPGKRVRDLVNEFTLPFRLSPRGALDVACHPAWAGAVLRRGKPRFANLEAYGSPGASAESLAALMASQSTARLDWRMVDDIRKRWPRRLLLKGVLDPEDARRAVDIGADGIVVSNHGGRQLDAAPAPLEVLPAVREAVGGRIAVLIDGGIRTGEDIAKALAAGADFVLMGRPWLYGVGALGPEKGAAATLRILQDEFDRALAHLGCPTVKDLSRQRLWPGDRDRQAGNRPPAP